MIKNCPMRHENGNCIPAGGFCTANKNICEALLNAYRMGKAQLSSEDATSDLISRQAAIDAIHCNIVVTGRENAELVAKTIGEFVDRIKALPTIQPEVLACGNGELVAQPEPQEGHWIRRDCGLDVECKCSRCGYKDFVEPRDEYWFKRNYCPNCGAKMKGERQK